MLSRLHFDSRTFIKAGMSVNISCWKLHERAIAFLPSTIEANGKVIVGNCDLARERQFESLNELVCISNIRRYSLNHESVIYIKSNMYMYSREKIFYI